MLELRVTGGAAKSARDHWNALLRRHVTIDLHAVELGPVEKIAARVTWAPKTFGAAGPVDGEDDGAFRVETKLPILVTDRRVLPEASGIAFELRRPRGVELKPLNGRKVVTLTLVPLRSSFDRGRPGRGRAMLDPSRRHFVRLEAMVTHASGKTTEHRHELLFATRQRPRTTAVRLTDRDLEMMVYLHEMSFLTEQTIIKLFYRKYIPWQAEAPAHRIKQEYVGGARHRAELRGYRSSAARRRLWLLARAGYITLADPAKAPGPEMRKRWEMYWHERPYLLGPRGREELLDLGRIGTYKPQRPKSKERPVPTLGYPSTHGSNETTHDMGLVELRYLLEQACRACPDEEEGRGLQEWVSERKLLFTPAWPMFNKGKYKALNRPKATRHPDAILRWRGGKASLQVEEPVATMRWALELEHSRGQSSPKSAKRYGDILTSYGRMIRRGWVDWVLYVFDDKSASKRMLNRCLPQVLGKERWWEMAIDPQFLFVAYADDLREALWKQIRTGTRQALWVWQRPRDRFRKGLLRPLAHDLWEIGHHGMMGISDDDLRWVQDQPEGMSAGVWVAKTPVGAEIAAQAVENGQYDTLRGLHTHVDDRHGGWAYREQDLAAPLRMFDPGEDVLAFAEVPDHAGVRPIIVMRKERDESDWSTREKERWVQVLRGFVHAKYLRLYGGWEKIAQKSGIGVPAEEIAEEVLLADTERSWIRGRGNKRLEPNGILLNEVFDQTQTDRRHASGREHGYTRVDLYDSVETFRKCSAEPAYIEEAKKSGAMVVTQAGTRVHRLTQETPTIARKRYYLWRVLIAEPDQGIPFGRWWVDARSLEPAPMDGISSQARWWVVDPGTKKWRGYYDDDTQPE